ncbi:hypothetical protein JTE90_006063 [Oedothorax gibbosus]|uniref:rRNA-processing protein UTP23 homolog n=1 Tax=Oedothorax gibbosus TaxID=931172 RepID=A0AAV6V6L1_9ARAC|nr:hypothetical protein JTE90_006063 [Oedothorax gibbosus]
MKISPHRRIRKYLNFYKSNFEFKTPYKIVVDETFCFEALTCQLNFREQVPKYLENESSKIFTTICAIKAAKKLGQKGADALKLVKELEVRPCDHGEEPVTSEECLFSLVKKNNPDRLFVATQNDDLVNKCRSVASVPVLYVLHNVVCLENPESSRTHQVKRKATEEASNTKKKPKKRGPKQSANSVPIKNIDSPQKNKADKQYQKRVPGENQKPGQEQKPHPFQLQKPVFNRRKSNFGHQKKFSGHKGRSFTKQFKKKPFVKKC